MSIVNHYELADTLRGHLPPPLQGGSERLAGLFSGLANGSLDQRFVQHQVATDPYLAAQLSALAGSQVTVGNAVVDFGADTQFGDVNMRDVAGQSIFHMHFAPSSATPTFQFGGPSALSAAGVKLQPTLLVPSEQIRDRLQQKNQVYSYASKEALDQLERRILHAAQCIIGTQVLWVDDEPASVLEERKILRSLGVFVDLAASNWEASQRLSDVDYDVVLSNMIRDNDPEAGIALARSLHTRKADLPVIIYISELDTEKGVPPHVFAIVERPDALVHALIDAVERVRL